mmetsp:Transcript_29950/g.54327  ORF Transcript_29950/g.54327 Transcript_29950/m.54327 type:complete len:221 (-) Transcript_29950:319-981(-)
MVSKQSWLSAKLMKAPSMLSRSYSSCSNLKMNLLNCCCSASLVKLMQSCSKELMAKDSKPKISKTPAEDRMSESFSHMMQSFTAFTTQRNIAPYTILANESRASAALLGVRSMRISSFLVTRILTVNAVINLSISTPNNLAASSTVFMSAIWAISCPPSDILDSNLTCPKCRMPAMMLRTWSTFCSENPMLRIDFKVYLSPSSSVNSRNWGAPPCPVRWK